MNLTHAAMLLRAQLERVEICGRYCTSFYVARLAYDKLRHATRDMWQVSSLNYLFKS